MSMIYCEAHDIQWDSDYKDGCPACEGDLPVPQGIHHSCQGECAEHGGIKMIDYSILPEHMQDGFRLYIEHGIPGGGFMTAVLENDLKGAFGKADSVNRARLFDIVQFMYMEMPSQSQGSPEKVTAWIAKGGTNGHQVV